MMRMSEAEADDSPAVDLMALLGRCLGNMSIVERVLVAFRESGSSDLVQLHQALDESDFRRMVEICHRFKGAASNVSSIRLSAALAQAERQSREQNGCELVKSLELLEVEWSAFERFSRAFAPVTRMSSLCGAH